MSIYLYGGMSAVSGGGGCGETKSESNLAPADTSSGESCLPSSSLPSLAVPARAPAAWVRLQSPLEGVKLIRVRGPFDPAGRVQG
jgi:hypothetical protein